MKSDMKKIDVIWNMTKVCPWDCPVCCVDAVHVAKKNGNVHIRHSSLREETTLPVAKNDFAWSAYEQAAKYQQSIGEELSYEQKLTVLDNLDGVIPKIDFSGGDPLVVEENIRVMKIASRKFGREQITLTTTGAGLTKCSPDELSSVIGELNFTYDSPSRDGLHNRPSGYAFENLKKAAKFSENGVATRGECPLTVSNAKPDILEAIYEELHETGIDKFLVMRLFPVGRGQSKTSEILKAQTYLEVIDYLKKLEQKYKSPKLKLQCALKQLDGDSLDKNPCDVVTESFGLTSQGELLASPWAINAYGKALSPAWVLGNLAQTSILEILSTDKAREFYRRADENYGHCKIFSFLSSSKHNEMDRIFDQADPLKPR